MTAHERTALVLGGGGSLGVAEVGFVRRITELGIPIDLVVGTSVGALNAAYVAFHEDPGHDCLREIWTGLAAHKLFHRNLRSIALNLIRTRMSLYDDSFVRELVTPHLASDDLAAARIPLYITATNLSTGERHIFDRGSVLQAILASTAIPGLFPPVRIEDDLFVDGAVSTPTDIAAAIELKATSVIAIDLRTGLQRRQQSHIVDVLLRSLEIIREQRSHCTTEHAQHQAAVVHIRPGLTTGNAPSVSEVERLLDQSYEMACSIFDECWDGSVLRPGSYQVAVPRGA